MTQATPAEAILAAILAATAAEAEIPAVEIRVVEIQAVGTREAEAETDLGSA